MPDLEFKVLDAEPVAFAAGPTLAFTLELRNESAQEVIQSVQLTAQIQIQCQRRRYTPEEKAHLVEVFGESHRWAQTLRPLLWTHASGMVPGFSSHTEFDLQVPCTFDFSLAATKYFDALSGGEIPLLFLFSGTIFYSSDSGGLQVSRISWSKEARFSLQAETWRDLIQLYYPNSACLNIRKDVFYQLRDYKTRHGLANWEEVFERLLHAQEAACHER